MEQHTVEHHAPGLPLDLLGCTFGRRRGDRRGVVPRARRAAVAVPVVCYRRWRRHRAVAVGAGHTAVRVPLIRRSSRRRHRIVPVAAWLAAVGVGVREREEA